MKKKSIAIFLLLILFIFGLYFLSLYLSVQNFISAIKEENEDELERVVDWGEVRANLRDHINIYIRSQHGEKDEDPKTSLEKDIFLSTVNKNIDKYVTPSGLLNFIKSKGSNTVYEYQIGWFTNIDQFKIYFDVPFFFRSRNPLAEKDITTYIILERKGWLWKVEAIHTPISIYADWLHL